MKNLGHEAAAETFLLSAFLALAGGFMDAYSFLTRGGVFANAETGNMVLLGAYLIQGRPLKALTYLVPVLAYALGILVTETVKAHLTQRWPSFHWRLSILGVEVLVLIGVAFLPEQMNMMANVLVAFTCAMQYESFRKVRGNAFASTMCTGNLRSGTEHLFRYFRSKDRTSREKMLTYYGIIAIFIGGAAIGALFCGVWGRKATLACAGILVVSVLLLHRLGREVPEIDEVDVEV